MNKKSAAETVVDTIKKVCKDYPEEVAKMLLDEHFWFRSLEPKVRYQRYDDDTYQGTISVTFGDDSDAWVSITSKEDPEDPLSHRFRIPLYGGGQSGRVRTALHILALAIKMDNEERPQHRPSRES